MEYGFASAKCVTLIRKQNHACIISKSVQSVEHSLGLKEAGTGIIIFFAMKYQHGLVYA